MMEFSADGINYDLKTQQDEGKTTHSIKLAVKLFKLKKGDILYVKEGNKVTEMRVQ